MTPSARRRINLARKYGWRCWFCGEEVTIETSFLTKLQPEHLGGESKIENECVACAPCSRQKRQRTVEEYRDVVRHQRYASAIASDRFREGLAKVPMLPKELVAGVRLAVQWCNSQLAGVVFYGDQFSNNGSDANT